MIDGKPPQSLTLYREGCELYEQGDREAASRLFAEAKALTEESAFDENLRELIDQRLAECASE